ncbi:MAG: right-handed parallel beta-helix repeat-containing protein [Rickettsiales bacterium]
MRHVGVRLLFLALLLQTSMAWALTPAEQLYLRAETEKDPGIAMEHWRALLPEAEKGALGKGISRDDVQINLVQAMIKRSEKDHSFTELAEAAQTANGIQNSMRKAWVDLIIARTYAFLGDPNRGLEGFERVHKLAQGFPEKEKIKLLGGIIKSLTAVTADNASVFGEEGLKRARELALEVKDPEAYAAIMQASAHTEIAKDNKDTAALLQEANAYIEAGNLSNALKATTAISLDDSDKRNEVFQKIADQAMRQDDWVTAQQALRGILDTANQSDAMLVAVEALLAKKEVARATEMADLIPEGGRAARAYSLIGKAYKEIGYMKRMEDALAKSWNAAEGVPDEERRTAAFAELGKMYADMGDIPLAEKALGQIEDEEVAYKTNAALADALAERKELEKAQEHFDQIEDASADLRIKPAAAIATLLAENGKPGKAQDLLDDGDYKGSRADKARIAVVKAYAESGEFGDADDVVAKISTPELAANANALIAFYRFKKGDKEEGGLLMEKALHDVAVLPEKVRSEIQVNVAELLSDMGQENQAKKLLAQVPMPLQKNFLLKQALQFVAADQPERAAAEIKPLEGTKEYDDAAAKISVEMVKERQIESAIRLTQTMKDVIKRVLAFHDIAVIQARHTDYYGILGPKEEFLVKSEIQPGSIQGNQLSRTKLQAAEKTLQNMVSKKDNSLLAMEMDDSAMGRDIPKIDTGKLGVTYKDVKNRMPAAKDGVVTRLLAGQTVFNGKFIDAMGLSNFVLSQQSYLPQIIYVESGVVDLPLIYDQMIREGQTDFIEKKDRTYILRRPIIVGPNATFVISGADVDELKLSEEKNAYIVNAGNLYIADTRVTGWSEKDQKPSWRVYEQKKIYRPYITSWSESKTYMTTTVFTALGYSNSKSYGISLSAGPKEYVRYRYDRLARPEAVIVDNSFDNLLYGFYSYEADNVVLVGNEYINNTVYGIDPHDRSRWFTIAYNTSYLAEKKHGIIISREVNDSTILGNVAYDNHGSGIMVDRQSSGTLIYANTAFDNGQDGVTIFESSCKIIASNQFFDNKRSGVKIRNSIDIGVYFNNIKNNKSSAIHGYVADLRNDPAHAHRDFELDPYSDVTALSVVGNWIENNGSGLYTDGMSALFIRKNRFVDQSPRIFRGNWSNDLPRIVSRHDIDNKGLLVTSRCPRGSLLPHHCTFRDEGIFNGDGQSNLPVRLKDENCQSSLANN